MSKKSILWIILDLVFLLVFNTVFFVASGFEHPASVWISYGFIHFAYLMILATPVLTKSSSSSSVFGFSIYSISSGYFFIEFIVGLVFIFIKSESFKAALIVQIIIAGIYAALLITHLLANESTADSVERHENEVAFIKTVSSRVKSLNNCVSDKKAKKEIERAYDAIHSSPTKSIDSVRSIETQIQNLVSDLENAVSSNNVQDIISLSVEIVKFIDERNRKLRTSN